MELYAFEKSPASNRIQIKLEMQQAISRKKIHMHTYLYIYFSMVLPVGAGQEGGQGRVRRTVGVQAPLLTRIAPIHNNL